MDTISSSEFRRRYATLKAPVQVTVNGHVIGEWTPVNLIQEVRAAIAPGLARYASRPFTPVPKKGR